MSSSTIRYRVAFRRRGESALVAPGAAPARGAGRTAQASSAAPTAPTAASGAPTPAARVLALAYAVERQVRAGSLRNYREAARRLGISHARMSQVMALLWLAPALQVEVVGGRAAWREVRLRTATQRADWAEHLASLRT